METAQTKIILKQELRWDFKSQYVSLIQGFAILAVHISKKHYF